MQAAPSARRRANGKDPPAHGHGQHTLASCTNSSRGKAGRSGCMAATSARCSAMNLIASRTSSSICMQHARAKHAILQLACTRRLLYVCQSGQSKCKVARPLLHLPYLAHLQEVGRNEDGQHLASCQNLSATLRVRQQPSKDLTLAMDGDVHILTVWHVVQVVAEIPAGEEESQCLRLRCVPNWKPDGPDGPAHTHRMDASSISISHVKSWLRVASCTVTFATALAILLV